MRLRLIGISILICLLATISTSAQDTPPIPDGIDTSDITDDQMNVIAHQLYCPVCENIPLDTCGTAACEDWREEIRAMLASGMSEEMIIDNFVTRFGDRVVSTPRDPIIAAISIITPWFVALAAFAFALYQIIHWLRTHQDTEVSNSRNTANQEASKRDSYRDQLERDLTGK